MAQKIRIKRRAALGGAGAPTTLAAAELAFNEASKILYYGLGDTGSGEAQTVIALLAVKGSSCFHEADKVLCLGERRGADRGGEGAYCLAL